MTPNINDGFSAFRCHAGRIANRPPDAALDPADVTMLDMENKAHAAMAQRDELLEQVKTLDRSNSILIEEFEAEQRMARRAGVLCAALFIALCWAEGWRLAAWVWRLL